MNNNGMGAYIFNFHYVVNKYVIVKKNKNK